MTPQELKEIRSALNLTSEELAEKIGVAGGTVRKWECNLRQPGGAALILLRQLQKQARRMEKRLSQLAS